jgi:uncharacterized membrane protein HdeD (DUF308 family)
MVTEQPTAPDPSTPTDDFTLDEERLTRDTINLFRTAFFVGGGLAVILGVVLLVWPVKVAAVVAGVLGIFFIVTGLIRVGLGIFPAGLSGGHRVLNIVLGILMFVVGVIALRNLATAAAVLLVLTVVLIGVGWVIDGVMTLVESRKAPSRGWAITYGIVSVVAGLVIIVVPTWSVFWLILFTSIMLIVLGIVGIVRGFTFGREVRRAQGVRAQPATA